MCTRHATFCVCPIQANCVASTTGHVDAGVAGKAYQVAVSVSIVTSIPSVPKKKKILRVATTQQILVVLVESWIQVGDDGCTVIFCLRIEPQTTQARDTRNTHKKETMVLFRLGLEISI